MRYFIQTKSLLIAEEHPYPTYLTLVEEVSNEQMGMVNEKFLYTVVADKQDQSGQHLVQFKSLLV